jgi:two-component system, cell cycle sensor histidine kinase and response regulator CckA
MDEKRHRPGPADGTAAGAEQALRDQAEERIRTGKNENHRPLSPEGAQRVLHELRVHQIELEMQNEELRRAQAELESARARYFDLYDLAPVGYCTISEQGLILEANLTAATLLGLDRGALAKQPVSTFVAREDHNSYYLHRKRLFETGQPQDCELRMVKKDGTAFWAHLAAVVAPAADGAPVCRVALSDITALKRAEVILKREREVNSAAEIKLTEDLRTAERSRLALLSILEDEKEAKGHLASKTRQLESLLSTVSVLGATLDINEICRSVDRAIAVNMKHTGMLISMLDPDGDTVRCLYGCSNGEDDDVSQLPPIPITSGSGLIQGSVIRTGKPEAIGDYTARIDPGADTRYLADKSDLRRGIPDGGYSALVVPLMLGNTVIGVLQVFDDRRDAFTDDNLWMVAGLASQLAAALSNARLFQQAADEIAQRQKAELALREGEEQYRTLVEGMNEGLIQVDNGDVIQFVNDRFCKLSGYAREELIGKVGNEFLVDEAGRAVIKQKNLDRLENKSEMYEIKLRRKDGQERWAYVSGAPVLGPGGDVTGSIGAFTDITERRQAEEMALVSEERYRTFVNSTSDLAFLKDDQMRYMMVNEANRKFFNLAEAEILGRTDFDLMPQENALACRRTDLLAMEKNQVAISEEHIGHSIYESRKFPVRLENGRTGVGGFIRDITDHRKADAALRASEEQYRDLVENINDAVFAVRADGVMTYISPAIRLIAGYGPEEIIGKAFLGFIHADDRAMLAEELEKTLAGDIHPSEYRMIAKDGSVRWVRSSSRPVWDDQKVTGLNGILYDITVHRISEEKLSIAAKKWEATFDSIGDGVCLLDRQRRVLQCNRAFSDMVARPFGDIIGGSCHEIVHGSTQPIPDCPVQRMERTLQRASGEIQRGDRWLLITVDPILDAGGGLIGAVHIVTDITSRKLMEQELQQAQKMEAIGQLAGGVAHDFNNMLAGIMGNAEMLYMKLATSPEHMELVERILKAGEHAANLTKQLLSFARKGQYQLAAVDVHRAIGNVAGILANTIDRRIRIKQSLRARPSTIMGDPTQIENALMNLALNARDAMPEGGELIFSTDVVEFDAGYVEQHQYRMEPGHYVMISVTDTGTGMDEEIVRHIFEPFFTTKGPGKGTGLGLASVYGTAKNHKGSIECYSEPGHGTVMKVYLPLTDNREALAPALPVASVRPGTGSLLLVDDEHMIREMAGQMLKGLGYTIATCQDGQEAVDYYLKHHAEIDLVILDMIMPKVNGREAFLLMRQINPGVRALLASGFSADGEAQEVLKLGILGFVQKPFRMAELSARIQEALGHGSTK